MTAARRRTGLGTPALVVPPAAIGVAFLLLPTIALVIRTPWSRLGAIYRDQHVWTALRISVESSLYATAASLVLGVPLVLPPVIGGVALFNAFGRNGVLGHPIHSVLGRDLPFSFTGIVLAQIFVAMPFLVITVEGAFRIADRGVEEAAATLGASRSRIFLRVTVPLVLPAIVAGSVLCWARALGEFGATLLFGGNVQGSTQTVPTLVLSVFQHDPADAPALALPLMAVALIVLVGLRDKWLRPVAS